VMSPCSRWSGSRIVLESECDRQSSKTCVIAGFPTAARHRLRPKHTKRARRPIY
jgi:hypothetical protein